MRKSVLAAALESVDPVQAMPREGFIEQVDNLRDASNEFSPGQLIEEEQQLSNDVANIDTLAEHAKQIEPDNQVAMESLLIGLNGITSRYGMVTQGASMESGVGQRDAVLAHIAQVKASLEGALTVSQESWAVRDLWDSIGAIERNASELDSAVRQLDSRKQWFSEHGIVINSLGQLKFLTLNEQMTKNFTKDIGDTLNHADNLLSCGEVATDTTSKIRDAVKQAVVTDDEDALALLKKVVALKNPSMQAKQKLDGAYLLGNTRAEVKITPVKNRNGLDVGDWENVGVYYRTDMGRLKHDVNVTKLAKIPMWLASFYSGANTTALVGGAVGAGAAVTGAAAIAVGVTLGFAMTTALKDTKAGKQMKHNIKFEEVKGALDKAVQLARKSASARRAMPSKFERMTTMRDEVKAMLTEHGKGLGPQGREAIDAIRTMYSSAEKLAWALNTEGFGLMREVVTNCDVIARKMITASK